MKRLIWMILLIITVGCAPLTITNKKPLIVSLYPESIYPPLIKVSVNQSVHPSQYRRIAIVGITHDNIPNVEDALRALERLHAEAQMKLEMAKVKADAKAFSAEIDPSTNPYYSKIDSIVKVYSDSKYSSNKLEAYTKLMKSRQRLEAMAYEGYEHLFLAYGFNVVERNEIEKILDELNLSDLGLIDEENAVHAGKMLAAQAVCLIKISTVAGEYYELPDPTVSSYTETIKAIVVESGQVAFTGMGRNVVNGRALMFNEIAKKILARYESLRDTKRPINQIE